MDIDNPLEHKLGADLFAEIRALFVTLIERDYVFLLQALLYGFAISLFTLAVPVAVQMLINSIAHTASLQAVISLAVVLFVILLIAGLFYGLQTYTLELFERRFYARITAQFALRNIYAKSRFFETINRYELANRYFDIMSVQKNVASLTTGMFTLLLQMLVGIILVSFYHPWLFLFNIVFLLIVYGVWRIWGYRAMGTAIDVSQAKYRTARHIEDIAFSNSFYKSGAHMRFAIAKADALTHDYIKQRKHHFKHTFSQHVALLILYALASATLLGVGGVLVVKNQLTLGQLVAAELILSAVFYGMSRMGVYLVQVYELGAAVEEITMIYQIPLESLTGKRTDVSAPAGVVLDHAVMADEMVPARFDFTIAAGSKTLASCQTQRLQEVFSQLLLRHRAPKSGRVLLGEIDLQDIEPRILRDRIIVLDRSTMAECSIREYLLMRSPSAEMSAIHDVLEKVELLDRIASLPQGLDTMLTVVGGVLSVSERLRLKLAAAWLARPSVLIINEFFDTISYHRRQRIFSRLCNDEMMTVIYFSNRKDLDMFDHYLFVGMDQQIPLASLDALRALEERGDF